MLTKKKEEKSHPVKWFEGKPFVSIEEILYEPPGIDPPELKINKMLQCAKPDCIYLRCFIQIKLLLCNFNLWKNPVWSRALLVLEIGHF